MARSTTVTAMPCGNASYLNPTLGTKPDNASPPRRPKWNFHALSRGEEQHGNSLMENLVQDEVIVRPSSR